MTTPPCKIVVVGGVAAGMSAAARLRRLNETAEIIVFERDPYVSFANCGLPYYLGGDIQERDKLLIVTPEDLKASLNLDIRTRHEVVAIDRAAKQVQVKNRATGESFNEPYDKLILAPGAQPIRPPLPGIEHPKIYTLRNIPDIDQIKSEVDAGARHAVVIGGGYIGVEMAEALRQRGLKVALVEIQNEIMPPLDPEMDRALIDHMEGFGITFHLGTGAAAFHDLNGRVEIELQNGVTVLTDLVILAIGVRPESSLARAAGLELGARGSIRVDHHMRTSDPDIYAAGDAVEVVDTVTGETIVVPLAGPANRQGRIIADTICGRESNYHSTQGTSVIKVFDMTGGGTGAPEKSLRRIGIPYQKVYLHHNGHAGYYPGTHPMHIKVLFAPETGRLLGAQVVGYDGVDKRIDVLATAIKAGMTVYDLEHLELAYAPPYGSAKDPINMVGFHASGVLRGDIALWYAEDYPACREQGTLLDVRSPQEYAEWFIEGAINIPHTELRERLAELDYLDRDAPLYVYCRSGVRSYIAYRVLVQSGFTQVASLAGGVRTFTLYHETVLDKSRPGAPVITHAEHKVAADPVARTRT